jgi:hypothetical protein
MHIYRPTYEGSVGRKIMILGQSRQKNTRPYLKKITKTKKDWGKAQVAEYLLSRC